jgi:hypothetical protein
MPTVISGIRMIWRGLARLGIQTERHLLNEQADILEDFRGPGDLKPVDMELPTMPWTCFGTEYTEHHVS